MECHYRWQKVSSPLKILLSITVLLSGCAELSPGWNRYRPNYPNSASQLDFDELLTFGNNLANSTSSARTKICRTLLKHQKATRDPSVTLHLMVARLLSDSCGDITRLIEDVRAIPTSSLPDTRFEKLIAIDVETLKRMNGQTKKTVSLECRQKSNSAVGMPKNSHGNNKSENNLLREKLEAIRAMEKKMDEGTDQ